MSDLEFGLNFPSINNQPINLCNLSFNLHHSDIAECFPECQHSLIFDIDVPEPIQIFLRYVKDIHDAKYCRSSRYARLRRNKDILILYYYLREYVVILVKVNIKTFQIYTEESSEPIGYAIGSHPGYQYVRSDATISHTPLDNDVILAIMDALYELRMRKIR